MSKIIMPKNIQEEKIFYVNRIDNYDRGLGFSWETTVFWDYNKSIAEGYAYNMNRSLGDSSEFYYVVQTKPMLNGVHY